MALSDKIRQMNNANLLKTDLFLVFATRFVRFVHALINNTELYLYWKSIWECLLVSKSPEILTEQNLQ